MFRPKQSPAWLGRGVRTPVRKALLAAAVDRSVYGRAFGFERAMDTLGAIVGPLTALWLLAAFPGNYRVVFAFTLLPGVVAAALIVVVVQEKERAPVPHASFGERLRSLPKSYGQLLLADPEDHAEPMPEVERDEFDPPTWILIEASLQSHSFLAAGRRNLAQWSSEFRLPVKCFCPWRVYFPDPPFDHVRLG